EHCEDIDGLLNTYRPVAPLENVIQRGEDVRQNQVVLARGSRLRPQELGILAALGYSEVKVTRPVKVGYLSSGDEIVPYQTKKLHIGQVRDINQVTVAALVEEWGGVPKLGGIVKDDFNQFKQVAQQLLDEVDFLVLSGGSSVGTKDFTTEVIQSL